MAGAPYGNKNAEKWNLRKAVSLFNEAIKLSDLKETYAVKIGERYVEVEGYTYDFIGEVARELGTFKETILLILGMLLKLIQKWQQSNVYVAQE